jgi:hypothetical protein
MSKRTYLKQWTIPSDNDPDKTYKVSLTPEYEFQCSCPRWIFKRELCKHIQDVASGVYDFPNRLRPKFNITFGRVKQVELQDDRTTVLLPLRPIGDTDFLATVLYDALMLGISWKEIKDLEKAPKEWRPQEVLYHVREHGRKIYVEGGAYLGANGFEYIRIE